MTWLHSTSDQIAKTKYDRGVRQTLPIVILGTIAWCITLVIELAANAEDTSIWIALVGISLGLLGTIYILRGLHRSR